jgi:hypothetical protein
VSDYYDPDGKAINLTEWLNIWKSSDRVVAKSVTKNGCLISTVYLGMNHRWGAGPPLIYETMTFPPDGDNGELDMERYTTRAEAEAGHARMVAKWAKIERGE